MFGTINILGQKTHCKNQYIFRIIPNNIRKNYEMFIKKKKKCG